MGLIHQHMRITPGTAKAAVHKLTQVLAAKLVKEYYL